MNRLILAVAFGLGIVAILWAGAGFVRGDALALAVTLVIGAVYLLGGLEILQFRRATDTLEKALAQVPAGLEQLDPWLRTLHPSLRNAVRLRIEGERQPLPGPVFAPYLIGLLVMLGLLGTFVGMVVTLQGAVLALEGTTELQAIRAGLTRPIQGLGMAFGTSVAGVAASAMLGLITTLSRRDRMQASRLLDEAVEAEFRPFSLAFQRQAAYQALQLQAQALPQLVQRLQDMSEQLLQRSQALGDNLLATQHSFQTSLQGAFTDLAQSVASSLQQHLADSARQSGETLQPLLTSTCEQVLRTSADTQQQLQQQAQQHLQQLAERFEQVIRVTTDTQQQLQQQTQQHLQQMDERVGQVVRVSADTQQQLQQQAQQHLQQMGEHFEQTSRRVSEHWQQGVQAFGQAQQTLLQELQQAFSASAQQSVGELRSSVESASRASLEELGRLLQASEQLFSQRRQTEQQWLQGITAHIEQLGGTLQRELGALRDAEAERGDRAVERLAALESAVAGHLAQLGTALEAPMTRLIESASQAPRAAAEIIEQMREKMAATLEHDNALLAERTRLLDELSRLLAQLDSSASDQRQAVAQLVASANTLFNNLGNELARKVTDEAGRLEAAATQLAGSSIEVASLGEAFAASVERFRESNEQLIDSFNRVQAMLDQSATRSDEQLAYYVAQAREIIDLSVMSQKEVFEELRRLARKADAETVEEVC